MLTFPEVLLARLEAVSNCLKVGPWAPSVSVRMLARSFVMFIMAQCMS